MRPFGHVYRDGQSQNTSSFRVLSCVVSCHVNQRHHDASSCHGIDRDDHHVNDANRDRAPVRYHDVVDVAPKVGRRAGCRSVSLVPIAMMEGCPRIRLVRENRRVDVQPTGDRREGGCRRMP